MNYTASIPIEEPQYNQLCLAAGKVNELDSTNSTRRTGPACTIRISRILPAVKDFPAMIEIEIYYRDLFTFWELAKHFGIILEKVNPHSL